MQEDLQSQFCDSETGKPIDTCMVCNKQLGKEGEDHFVERIFRRIDDMRVTEPIFEYAMCMTCAEQMRSSLSDQSKARVEAFFEERLMELGLPDPSEKLEVCLLTRKHISECIEFSYHGHFQGLSLSYGVFPYAISDEAMEQIAELLSPETLDELDDFKGKYFSGPPELAKLINPKRLIPL